MPNMKPEKTPMPAQDPIVRSGNFEEVEYGYTHEMALEEALENLKRATRRYAKRQLTWFRRNERVHWLCWEDYDTPGALYGEACRLVQESDWGRIR